MKTAVSISDELYQEAERLARQTKKSRSRVYSEALREYLARHAPDEVTKAMDRACAEAGVTRDGFASWSEASGDFPRPPAPPGPRVRRSLIAFPEPVQTPSKLYVLAYAA